MRQKVSKEIEELCAQLGYDVLHDGRDGNNYTLFQERELPEECYSLKGLAECLAAKLRKWQDKLRLCNDLLAEVESQTTETDDD